MTFEFVLLDVSVLPPPQTALVSVLREASLSLTPVKSPKSEKFPFDLKSL